MDKTTPHIYGTITYLRIPPDLRAQVDALAQAESRLISQQLLILIRKGLATVNAENKPATPPARRARAEAI